MLDGISHPLVFGALGPWDPELNPGWWHTEKFCSMILLIIRLHLSPYTVGLSSAGIVHGLPQTYKIKPKNQSLCQISVLSPIIFKPLRCRTISPRDNGTDGALRCTDRACSLYSRGCNSMREHDFSCILQRITSTSWLKYDIEQSYKSVMNKSEVMSGDNSYTIMASARLFCLILMHHT